MQLVWCQGFGFAHHRFPCFSWVGLFVRFIAASSRGFPKLLNSPLPAKLRWAIGGLCLPHYSSRPRPTDRRYSNRTSPYSRIAFPLNPGHLARENINIERAIVPDAAFLSLLGYGVMSGRQGNPKSPLVIRGERCDFRSLFVLHDESGIRERFRTGSVRPDWPTLSWAKRNHSFHPCS